MHPTGRIRLDVADSVGEGSGGFQADEEMDVVGDTTDGLGNSVEIADDAAEVGVEVFPPGCGDEGGAVFRAEDDVIVEGEMGGWNDRRSVRMAKRIDFASRRFGGGRNTAVFGSGPEMVAAFCRPCRSSISGGTIPVAHATG